MNLQAFGEQLQTMRKRAGLSQERLADTLDQAARGSAADDYRVVDGTLVSRWERARASDSRQWRPTRSYVLHLVRVFASQLDARAAQAWAGHAGYVIGPEDLAGVFDAASAGAPAARGMHRPPRVMPLPLTSFIGREREVYALLESLADPAARLITIVGAGGSGKTRLALAAAHAARDEQLPADGVCFVPLVGVHALTPRGSGPNPVVSAIAKSLSLAFNNAGDEPTTQLIRFLQDKAQLLILDNCEHLIDETAFVIDLLALAPGVRIWVTSRVPLNCQAERLLWLSGLPVPAAPDAENAAMLAMPQLPSVALFVARARQRNHAAAQFDAHTLGDIVTLCRIVDGSPLALELAANWVGRISTAEMVRMLQRHDLSLLATDQRDLPARHRSIAAVFEASWQMLTVDQQRVLARLSVFQGAFTQEAAAAVAGASLTELIALVDRSLLCATPRRSEATRYDLHELLCQFAAAKLQEAERALPAAQRTEQRHAGYYLSQLLARRDAFYGANASAATREINADIDNVRAAWHWSAMHGAAGLLEDAWLALQNFYHVSGLYHEAEAVFADTAAHVKSSAASAALAGDLQTARAFFLNQLNRYAQAISVAAGVLDHAEQPMALTALRARLEWGVAVSLQSKHAEAITRLHDAAEQAHAAGADLLEARATHAMVRNLLAKDDLAGAEAALNRATACFRRAGHALAEGFLRDALGHIARRRGRLAQAIAFHQDALAVYDQLGDGIRAMWSQSYLASTYAEMGALGLAYRLHGVAYAQHGNSQDQRAAANALVRYARLLAQLGDYSQALREARQALDQFRQMGYIAGVIEALCTLGRVQQHAGDAQSSLASFQEALALSDSSGTHHAKPRALLGVGQALLALQNAADAQIVLQNALSVQKEKSQSFGSPSVLCALARCAWLQGRAGEALNLVGDVLACVASPSYESAGELPELLWACYHILHSENDSRAASVLQSACHAIQTQADSIDDAHLRQQFLTGIETNRLIIAASA